MKIIPVTCAIITKDDQIIVVQRSEKMKLPLKWEFPGGKLEQGESEEDCIIREIREELNIHIKLNSRLTKSQHQYADFIIELIPFRAVYESGEIFLSEHKQFLLLKKHELQQLDWADADLPILKEFLGI